VSLKLPYLKYPDARTGGFFYAAVIPVHIALPAQNAPRSKRFEANIDSGASFCHFHSQIGRAIGLEIEKGVETETQGISGPTKIFLHDISLYLPGGIVTTCAGFSDRLPVSGLLGMTGFFEHFKVIFDPTALRCELERIFRA